ncbi:5-bromo-4-chloroindolyl phosphate hydrolysis family protein [Sulfitobacter pseudonitzschiae]|uniref:5-bromo-4-chloroindolyl phosphate hydrolysis family protein n=1 Tax=Pseudosulfitobacter pseudonitzschiae TaxID=1402135 RepID=A0A9Q2P3S3_9RHOB|nr:5-bromo-4-chloroindolyl phosphate hydrolysis family protein [Pseudosulfitobacter pseudonitzschiae]MBM2293430.1 5-bromo-4-chloroindolyl phosphate hydrolysis family protein [Pseudosulfitobacter pseudonitzschiae]MBM2298244.1 5-bromo-4-chloroindolyl phosphate hydrolysis family protein [Pseudosulfitobacter pseudonitzschiae]MBM2303158.1 5-bromo-4-chloroindolyl phosphate hydrolysis family protein [Pseudosulfitobacter pseudonitzschiae]MBM2312941.1 5-bromo-4-chloroindolyl phosphate hydrolysis family 
MAQRYGGKFSTQGDTSKDTGKSRGFVQAPAQVDAAGLRSNLMFLPPLALALTSFGGGPVYLATGLVGAAVWVLAAVLTREGLRAEAAYHDRKVARRPALPRKMLASVAVAAGAVLAGITHQSDVISSVIYGVIAGGLHVAAFGIDPLRSKGMEGVDTFQQDRVARVVDEAENYLREMSDALLRANDRKMETRLAQFQAKARTLIRTVEEDPRDLTAARRYLGVYLMGARDATVKFADIYARTRDAQARADYAALLDDLEQNFDARTQSLLLDDRSDLNIEIDVLRERLQREGVHIASQKNE